jgi:hypothetical protein
MLRFTQHDKLADASLRNASFSMTNWWMLRFVQHDRLMSFRTLSFVIPSACEESSTWMLRFAQHDKTEDVIPSVSEESSMDASLRSA